MIALLTQILQSPEWHYQYKDIFIMNYSCDGHICEVIFRHSESSALGKTITIDLWDAIVFVNNKFKD